MQDAMSRDSITDVVSKDVYHNCTISTVFLGMGSCVDDLFETMIFCDRDVEFQVRCSTYEEAMRMHKESVGRVLEAPTSFEQVSMSPMQLEFLGERESNFESLDAVDQFTCMMLS